MTRLLEKDRKFVRTPECEQAFCTLRTLLTLAPVLAQPDIENRLMCIVMHRELV
jgi:hypothetical protein